MTDTTFRLLLADSDVERRLGFRRMLQGLDTPIEFAEVTNVAATLDILRERTFHCAFLDLEDTDPGGLWVLKSAAAQGISTPVVMLVGDHGAQALSDAMNAGAAACLPRPSLSADGLSKTPRCLVRLHRAEVKADQFFELLEFRRRGLMMVFDATRMVCHDLRGSLSTIMTTTTLLRHKIHKLTPGAGDLEALGTQQLEAVLRNVQQMDRTIGELADVAAITAGRFKITPAAHDIETLLHDSVAPLSPAAAENGIRLTAQMPGEEIFVDCDRDRILQLLGSLVSGAIAFTPEGETISVSAASESSQVRVSVSDGGSGILAGQLLQSLERPGQPTRTRHPSNILQLAICERHRPGIWRASFRHQNPGPGGAFCFTLPLAQHAS
jgi:signal transduction histidine kinase